MPLRHCVCGSLLLMGLLALTVGCGPSAKPRATVKGKVTYKDKSLTAGNIIFYSAKDPNLTASAAIDKTGNYQMNDAPIGDVKISVTVPKVNPAMLAKMNAMRKGTGDGKSVDPSGSGMAISIMGDMPENVVPIPDKFGDPQTSGLTYTVEKGEQTKDLNLTP